MKDFLEFLLIAVVVTAFILGVSIGVYVLIGSPYCEAVTQSIGYPHKWEFASGCMIEVEPDRWIPLENFRYFDE